MAADADSGDTTLTPDDAFAVLGNETRMSILQSLAEANEPLSFTELRERVGVSDSGQFNYHLDKLVGHFLADTENGYELRRAGARIIEAIVSGAVTESPEIEPTEVEWPCSQCGAPVEVSYQQEWVALSCTECPGMYGSELAAGESAPDEQLTHGYLGGLNLPPAAVQGRDPTDVVRTAIKWDFLERLATSSGICPRCSAPMERTLTVCDEHDADDGLCEACGTRNQVTYEATCQNCPLRNVGPLPSGLQANTDVIDFLTDHGINPLSPTQAQWETVADMWEEELVSFDPFEARLTYTLEGDVLAFTVDEYLNVSDVSRKASTD